MEPDARALSWPQAYEATYRFIVRYYEHERLKPILRLLQSTYGVPRPERAAWKAWEACVRETLAGSPLPKIPQPWE